MTNAEAVRILKVELINACHTLCGENHCDGTERCTTREAYRKAIEALEKENT